MVIEEATSTTDADIRAPLLAWLRLQHCDDVTARTLEEFKMPRPSARIDVALINGEMAGFEIKSDRDTLSRLSSQVPAFSKFFDKVTLVTTRKHLRLAESKIPNWWGVIVFRGDHGFEVIRAAKLNNQVDPQSFLFALSKKELLSVAASAGVPLPSAVKKDEMVLKISSLVTHSEIRRLARDVIKLRVLP
jgi:hypothetical protein